MEFLKKRRQQSGDSQRRSAGLDRRDSTQQTDRALSPLWQRVFLLVVFSLILGVLVTPHYIVLPVNFQVGDVVDRSIKAVHDFLVTDEAATQRKKEEAGRESLAVYDLDEETVENLRQRLGAVFSPMRSLFQQPAESSVAAKGASGKGLSGIHKSGKELALEKKKDFDAQLGINISDADYAILVNEKFDLRIENSII
jgi:membrane-associated HD superfamily phosphohydrolase